MDAQKLDSLTYGVGGFSASVIADPVLTNADASSVVSIIVQLIIGVATLIGMFKKGKKN